MSHSGGADIHRMDRRRRRVAAGAVAFALLASGVAGTGALAQTVPPTDEPTADPSAPPLAPVDADEAGRRQAAAILADSQRELRVAQRAKKVAVRKLGPFERTLAAREQELTQLSAEEHAIAVQLDLALNDLKTLAVEHYMSGGQAAPLNYVLTSKDASQLARRQVIAGSAADAQQAAVDRYTAAREAASVRVGEGVARAEEARHAVAVAQSVVAASTGEVERLQGEVAHRKLMLDLVTAGASALPTDIPRLFYDAYQRAATETARTRPTCKVAWTALAAIGRIESNHGRSKGGRVALNGDVWPVILGRPLDGTNNTRRIADTDKGEYDGDTVVDRAVGPMQFIPSTWKRVKQDGNGDGATSPNNAYDATLAAAVYLCRAVPPGGLDVEDRLRVAFYSYNHSNSYVDAVVGLWKHYESLAPEIR